MSNGRRTTSAVVKAGMDRVCDEFTELVTALGFIRTRSRSRSWVHRGDKLVRVIYFHRLGSSYGAPIINNAVNIRVHFSIQNLDGSTSSHGQLTSEHVRDSRGYAYHLRFNALSWSAYDR